MHVSDLMPENPEFKKLLDDISLLLKSNDTHNKLIEDVVEALKNARVLGHLERERNA